MRSRSPTSSQLWAARQETSSIEDVKLRQHGLGELCWLAAAPRLDFRARLAHIAARVKSPQGGDVYRINDLAKTVEGWQVAASSKNLTSSHMSKHARGVAYGEVRQRGENSWLRDEISEVV